MAGLTKPRRRCALNATVLACDAVGEEHVCIELLAEAFPRAEPGQFLQLLCGESDHAVEAVRDWPTGRFPRLAAPEVSTPEPFLRRPFSIGDQWFSARGDAHLIVISHAIGVGTRWLADLTSGQTLNITGPLGAGFTIPTRGTPIILVGGGVGIPPLLFLARRLREQSHEDVTVILGARRRGLLPVLTDAPPSTTGQALPCMTYPGDARFPTVITTDDGSLGMHGTVIDALRALDPGHKHERASEFAPVVFACGPEGMLKAVARFTRELGLAVGSDIGAADQDLVRARDAAQPAGWRWKLACQDGPVFDRDVLLDYD